MDSQRGGQGGHVQIEDNDAIVSRLALQDRVPWFCKPNLRLLYFFMFLACVGVELTFGFNATMLNGLQAVPSWLQYFNYPHSTSLGLMTSMFSLGCVAAIPFAPIAADRLGRRSPILLGGIISIVGSIMQGSALDFTTFVIARFILGFAIVFCVVGASSLIGELSHPKERAIIGCLFLVAYASGAIAAAAVTLGTFSMESNWGWRIPSFLQVIPSLLQVLFIWFIPESPRWLISRGRGNEAYAILVKYHAEGDENSEFVKAEYSQIEQMLGVGRNVAQINRKHRSSMAGVRKRVIIAAFLGLMVNWSGDGLISHYLSPILDKIGIHDNRTKNIINLSRSTWDFVNGAISAFIAPRYPRRSMYLACTTSLCVVLIVLTVASAEYSFTHNKVFAQVVLVVIFLFSSAYNLAVPLNYSFMVELFPFHLRAQGIALFELWASGGGFFIKFINPIGLEAAGWRWYITCCVWNAFQVVFVYLMFPETSGRTLEELTFLYEEDREAFGHDGIERLHGHGETGTYGTMGDYPRGTPGGEQG